jgi:hypothetical protein
LPYAPLHTKILQNAIFDILCLEQENYQNRIVALWNIQRAMLRSFGAHEAIAFVPAILALEGIIKELKIQSSILILLKNLDRWREGQIFENSSLENKEELFGCLRAYFVVFFRWIAEYLNCPHLNRYISLLLESWHRESKLLCSLLV